jgi:hypothetical protein
MDAHRRGPTHIFRPAHQRLPLLDFSTPRLTSYSTSISLSPGSVGKGACGSAWYQRAVLAVFFFLANWNSFLWPLTITSDPELWVVQTGIASFQTQYASAQNYFMAAATVVAMPTMVLFVIFQRQLVESIKTSGFK